VAVSDQDRATALMHEIGAMIAWDSRYAGLPWEAISLVAIV
jgi:hypothetical protein